MYELNAIRKRLTRLSLLLFLLLLLGFKANKRSRISFFFSSSYFFLFSLFNILYCWVSRSQCVSCFAVYFICCCWVRFAYASLICFSSGNFFKCFWIAFEMIQNEEKRNKIRCTSRFNWNCLIMFEFFFRCECVCVYKCCYCQSSQFWWIAFIMRKKRRNDHVVLIKCQFRT